MSLLLIFDFLLSVNALNFQNQLNFHKNLRNELGRSHELEIASTKFGSWTASPSYLMDFLQSFPDALFYPFAEATVNPCFGTYHIKWGPKFDLGIIHQSKSSA